MASSKFIEPMSGFLLGTRCRRTRVLWHNCAHKTQNGKMLKRSAERVLRRHNCVIPIRHKIKIHFVLEDLSEDPRTRWTRRKTFADLRTWYIKRSCCTAFFQVLNFYLNEKCTFSWQNLVKLNCKQLSKQSRGSSDDTKHKTQKVSLEFVLCILTFCALIHFVS